VASPATDRGDDLRPGPAGQLDRRVADRTGAPSDQHAASGKRTGRQSRRPALDHREGPVRGQERDTEVGAHLERGVVGQRLGELRGHQRELLRCAGQSLVRRQPHPHALTDPVGVDALANLVDGARAVLVRHLVLALGDRHVRRAATRLPVGRIDP